ncbi:MAG: hypothetical protein HYV29_13130 [Ignavibacteriales bacterium]|nr:hypothetical protein [Ignavibacteriales bacterium]
MSRIVSFRVTTLVFGCAVSLLLLTQPAYSQIPAKHDHEIPSDSAKKFIGNLKKDAMQMKLKGGMFSRDAFEKILAQKGVIGIRYYYAKMDDGTPTLVLVGVDSTGKDMTKGVMLERTYPCPPYCDDTSALSK